MAECFDRDKESNI